MTKAKMKLENLEFIFAEYLKSSNTPYAILINGSWGTGKTHFWKSRMVPLAEKENFKSIYISLNGISKIETLEYQLFVQLLPFMKTENKVMKRITTTLSNVALMVNSSYLKGGLNELLKGVGLDTFNFSKYVVCFDDLERSKIEIKEILGFINNYVEHKSLKVVVLSDESKITNEGNYDNIKEKVIGRIWSFEPDIPETLPHLFETYQKDNDFYKFLESHKALIIEIAKDYQLKNLRVISFCFSLLHSLSSQLKDIKRQYVEEVIFFIIIISNEFKIGKLTSLDYDDFKNLNELESYVFSKEVDKSMHKQYDREAPPPTYAEDFYNRYISNKKRDYWFLPSIYKYVLTGYLDSDLFKNEMKLREPIEVSEKIKSFQSLISHKFRELTDENFNTLVDSVYKWTEEGEYSIYDYSSIAAFFFYFIDNKIINLTIEQIQTAIYKGLSIAKNRKEFNENILSNLMHFTDANTELAKVKREIQKIHDEVRRERLRGLSIKFIDVLMHKPEHELAELFYKYKLNRELFPDIDRASFYSAITVISNKQLFNFMQQIQERYNFSNVGEILYCDYEALKNLNEDLIPYLDKSDLKQPRKYLMKSLAHLLSETCQRMELTKK